MDSKKNMRFEKIISVLAANPDGVWLRNLAKDTNIPVSTLHGYIEMELSDIVESIGVKDKNGKYFGLRVIRLKPKIFDVLEAGGMDKLRGFLEMSRKMKES